MLERVVAPNAVVFYRSPRLHAAGVPHAFSTRLGGVSHGPFESLNLGNPGGVPQQDSADHISENYRRLHAAIGCGARRRYFAHQIHGNVVLNPATSPQTDSIHGGCEIGKGDALVSNDPARLLSVRTADCVPVLLASLDGRRVAACHAGWRGVIAGVVTEALRYFAKASDDGTDDGASDATARAVDSARESEESTARAVASLRSGGRPSARAPIIAAIGPCIGDDAFEVGPEVADEFDRLFGRDSPTRRLADGKARVDLKQALLLQLRAAGVPAGQIDSTDRCTVTHADEFFSHRRDRGITGRMAAVIGTRI